MQSPESSRSERSGQSGGTPPLPEGPPTLRPDSPAPRGDAPASNWEDWLLESPPAGGQTDRATGKLPITQEAYGDPWDDRSDTGPLSLLKDAQILSLNGRVWRIEHRLGKDSGESQVYLVRAMSPPADEAESPAQDAAPGKDEGELAVLKYYFPGIRPKLDVLESLKQIRHPGVVRILDAGFYHAQCFEILEYASGGDLLQSAPIQDPVLLKRIVSEAAAGLDYCHRRQIVHRDIKPDNLFFASDDRERVMIGDFGIASKMSEDDLHRLTSQSRTPIYAAPEVYQSIAGQTVIQPEMDYYSLGVTLLYLWTGRNPFSGLNEFQIMQAKLQGRLAPPANMPEALSRLVRGLLTVRTDKRWGPDEIRRWLAGEAVPVYDAPAPVHQPFKFGTDAHGEPVLAHSPAELARLLQHDEARGLAFLHSGALRQWLELIGEHDMALALAELSTPKAGLGPARHLLDPHLPLVLGEAELNDPAQLAPHVYAGSWDDDGWPAAYQQALDALAAGTLQAWLIAHGRGELVSRWSDGSLLGYGAAAPRDLERLLRLLDPALPPVKLSLDTSNLRPRQRLLPGEQRRIELSYSTTGPGVPRAELHFRRAGQPRQTRLINARQGKLTLSLGTPVDRAYCRYVLSLELVPEPETSVESSRWELPYGIRYPWASTGRGLLLAGIGGVATGLALRGAISYKYPKPLKSYFGTGLSPAQARGFKDPHLDYVLYGWLVAGLLLLNLLVRLR